MASLKGAVLMDRFKKLMVVALFAGVLWLISRQIARTDDRSVVGAIVDFGCYLILVFGFVALFWKFVLPLISAGFGNGIYAPTGRIREAPEMLSPVESAVAGGDYARAEAMLRDILRRRPGMTNAVILLDEVLRKTPGREIEAVEAVEEFSGRGYSSRRPEPDFVKTVLSACDTLQERDEYARAVTLLDRELGNPYPAFEKSLLSARRARITAHGF